MRKSQLNLSIPIKTFLMGEYLALSSGPSLVVATQPEFRFDFYVGSFEDTMSLQSPAGLYYQKVKDQIGTVRIDMNDPLSGRGGFGASTAQFLALWLYVRATTKKSATDLTPAMAVECWQEYRSLFPVGQEPSGADLLNQMCGGLTIWNPEIREVQRMEWPFGDMAVQLYKTPFKIKTHEHLATLDKASLPLSALKNVMDAALKAVQEKNSSAFLRQSCLYTEVLDQAGLQAKETIDLLMKISEHPDVFSARGCGALGADVIAVYTKPRSEVDLSDLDLLKISEAPENLSSGPVWRWNK